MCSYVHNTADTVVSHAEMSPAFRSVPCVRLSFLTYSSITCDRQGEWQSVCISGCIFRFLVVAAKAHTSALALKTSPA